MTVEEKVKQFLLNSMTEDQIEEALRLFKESEASKPMEGRWLDTTEDHPPTLFPVLLLSVKQYCKGE